MSLIEVGIKIEDLLKLARGNFPKIVSGAGLCAFLFCMYQCNTTPRDIKEKLLNLKTEAENLMVDVEASQRRHKQDSIMLAASILRVTGVLTSKYADLKLDTQKMKIQTTFSLTPAEEKWAEREMNELKELKTRNEALADKVVSERKKANELNNNLTMMQDEVYRNRLAKWLWFFGSLISTYLTIWGIKGWRNNKPEKKPTRSKRK